MDIVERLLGRSSTNAAASSNTRADSIDVHTKRMAMAQHSNFTREDSISVAKRRSLKARGKGLGEQERSSDSATAAAAAAAAVAAVGTPSPEREGGTGPEPSMQARPGGRSSCPSVQPSCASSGLATPHHKDRVLHNSEIDLLSPEEQEVLSRNRTDSIQLARLKNPHIAKQHHDRTEGAGSPEPGSKNRTGIIRQIIHRLTGSVISQAQQREPGERSATSASGQHPHHHRRSVMSDPGDGNEPHLHRYCPPPPGVHIRPALTHRPTDIGTPLRTKSTSWQERPILPGTPTRTHRTSLDIQPSIGANGLDSTFTHADILSVPSSTPFT